MHATTQATTQVPQPAMAHANPLAIKPEARAISAEAAWLLAQARNAAYAEAAHGRVGQGLMVLMDALEQEPMAHDLLSDMAALLLSAAELKHAESYARQALAISADHGPSLYTLAFAQGGQGFALQARQTLRQLLQGEGLLSLMNEAPDLYPVAQTELARLEALLG
jgi:tetratricopeptide (TPR) repeat protein